VGSERKLPAIPDGQACHPTDLDELPHANSSSLALPSDLDGTLINITARVNRDSRIIAELLGPHPRRVIPVGRH
jgi:hypothetical protein